MSFLGVMKAILRPRGQVPIAFKPPGKSRSVFHRGSFVRQSTVPDLSMRAQLLNPFLQNGLIRWLDLREGNPHSAIR
jgi:hypothetical protein